MGVRKNFAYNLVLTFFNFLFPLITYPYVTRVLGVENIGICNFVDNLINYSLILANLGITVYGVREIARQSDDRERYTEVFSSLFFINGILSAVVIAVLCVLTFFVPFFSPYKDYLLVGIGKIVFNLFLIEWFFSGLQEFKFITMRSVIVRFLYVIAVLLFVRDEGDTFLFFILTCSSTVFGGILDWFYSRKFVRFSFSSIRLGKYFIPVAVFGIYMVLTAMYTNFNTIYLGFVSNDTQVGYFGVASKLNTVLLAVFTAFTNVMIPRVSYLLKQGEMQHLQDITGKIFSAICAISLPLIVFCLFYAEDIVLLIAGDGYQGAVPVFRVVVFLLFIMAVEQIVIGQFLLSSDSNKGVIIVCGTGAVVGIVVNLLLTSRLGAIGSSIAWGLSELAVLIAGLILVKKNMNISLDIRQFFIELAKSVLYVVSLGAVFSLIGNNWVRLGVGTVVMAAEFIVVNMVFPRNQLIVETYSNIINKFSRS